MQPENEMEIEYSLSEIFSILIKRAWIIVLCVVIATAGAFIVTKFVIDEKYTSSVSMYVAPNSNNVDVLASLSELNYAQEVVNTYIEILKTNSFMTSVAYASGLGYSQKDLAEMVEINAVNDTEIFMVTITTEDADHSLKLANTIAQMAPQKIIEIKDADAVRVVDPAVLPIEPSSPNVLKNTAIGLALGLMAGVMLAFLLEMLDKRVKSEDELVRRYNLPVLGSVPRFDN